MAKAFGYIRESTKGQQERGYRPEEQKQSIKKFCEQKGITLLKDSTLDDGFFEDAGSGRNTDKRPNFLRMIDRAEREKEVQFIICKGMSRYFRNAQEGISLLYKLEKQGIFVLDVKIDKAPLSYLDSGEVPHNIWKLKRKALNDAEDFSHELSENVKEGYQGKMNTGGYTGKMVLGLEFCDELKHHVKIIPEEAEVIREIFRLYATRQFGFSSLSRHLNKLGFKAKKYKKTTIRHGSKEISKSTIERVPFTKYFVEKMLVNRSYLGERNKYPHLKLLTINDEGVESPLAATIDQELFDEVQLIIKANKKGRSATAKQTSRQKRTYLLQNIGFCSISGAKLQCQTDTSNETRYYRSTAAYKGTAKTHIPMVRADEAESAIINLVRNLTLTDIQKVEVSLRQIINLEVSSSTDISEPKQKIEQHITGLKKILENLRELAQYGSSNTKEIKRYENQIENLKKEKESLSKKKYVKYYDLKELKKILTNIREELLETQDLAKKEEILKILFSHLYLGKTPKAVEDIEQFANTHTMFTYIQKVHEIGEENLHLTQENIDEAFRLDLLLKKYVPFLFEKIYVHKEKEILNISYEPSGLFLILADSAIEPAKKKDL